jgi:chorismate-pyruvate lyase
MDGTMAITYVGEKHFSTRLTSAGFGSLFRRLKIGEEDISIAGPADIEEPFRAMLVHSKDMTPTLESMTGGPVGLTVLCCERRHNVLFRQVLLLATVGSGKPLAFGNIRILLDNLPTHARLLVLDGVVPFGAILQQECVQHKNASAAFFRVRLNRCLAKWLSSDCGRIAYGRYRTMIASTGVILSQVMEILSPSIFAH